ncbi:MAG: hypothetical protein MUO53_07575 [Maribacter sp.]|nr:hypothetical protein [Maribacter sp.]
MKKYALLSLVAILAASCSAQEKNKSDLAKEPGKSAQTEPKGSWQVNKEVDENGNLIRYDSIYSWSSTDNPHGISSEELDSITQRFGSYFGKDFSMFGDEFSGFSQNDSLFMKHFFNDGIDDDDLFLNHFQGNMPNIQEIMKQMDSLQNLFLEKQQSRVLIPKAADSLERQKI